MSFADLIRGGVALAHQVTRDGELQETVTLDRWKAQDDYAKPTYATRLTLTAMVAHKSRRVKLRDGEETVATETVAFLDPIPELFPSVAGREEPVDKRDRITFADGRTGQILQVDTGLRDPATGRPYVTQVLMGA